MSKPEQVPAAEEIIRILSEATQEQISSFSEDVSRLLNDPKFRQGLRSFIDGSKDRVSTLQQSVQALSGLLLGHLRDLPPVLWEISKKLPAVLSDLEQDNDRKERIRVYGEIGNVLSEQLQINPLVAYLA